MSILPRGKTSHGWQTGVGICSTNPVVITYDHPDIGTGVDLGFQASPRAIPLYVLIEVTEAFTGNGSYVDIINQDGDTCEAGSYSGSGPPMVDAVCVTADPIGSVFAGDKTPLERVKIRCSDPGSQGSLKASVLYFDPGLST